MRYYLKSYAAGIVTFILSYTNMLKDLRILKAKRLGFLFFCVSLNVSCYGKKIENILFII